ncbi:MAG: alpha/beta hydrolase [Gemmatimonadetes bacterium]|nr:alpha/beta hydrolase [Gemmatimonadota bacterium]
MRVARGHCIVAGAIALIVLLWPGFASPASSQQVSGVIPRAPANRVDDARYLFYLHGQIVENQGPSAVSPDYGPYEYDAIVRTFADSGFIVISEVRAADTDPQTYADSIMRQVRRLLGLGVPPAGVTVVGASKGGVIAMLASTGLDVAGVRFVLLANCNDAMRSRFTIRLHGDVLSIYDASDTIGQSCTSIFQDSPGPGRRQEVRLDTRLGHGFIFRPLAEWVGPAVAWARSAGG